MAEEEKVAQKKKGFGLVLLDEVRQSPLTVTILAIFTGLLLGGLLAAVTSESLYTVTEGDFVEIEAYEGEDGLLYAEEVTRISEEEAESFDSSELHFAGEFKRSAEIKIEIDEEFVAMRQWRVGQHDVIFAPGAKVNIPFFTRLGLGFQAAGDTYEALFVGAFGSPKRMIGTVKAYLCDRNENRYDYCDPEAFEEILDGREPDLALRWAFNPFFEGLVKSTPYIFAGLAVALGFRVGLFNIGAEGQLFIGALTGVTAALYLKGWPPILHIPVALVAGALGGAIWGYIPGLLKAKTGGHEVINTIMMNYIAFRLSEFLLNGVLKGAEHPVTAPIEESARLPRFFGDPIRIHLGFLIALAMAVLVWWFLFRTKWGFDLRTVGSNPRAARYAGMNISNATVLAMALSGALAGLAGANEVLGVNYNLAVAFASGYGFDSIALALLGKSHPVGVVLAALLFGFLRNGAIQMQVGAGIPVDIISVIQAFILAFIAAPAIVRSIYRLKVPEKEVEAVRLSGWGGD
jgi:simple sugar transport system permease protein